MTRAHFRLTSFSRTACSQAGFSLIELSIALTIIGVVVAGGLSLSTSVVERQAYVETNNQLDTLELALSSYVASNGFLPCPADPTLPVDSNNFGVAVANCNGTNGTFNNVVETGSDPRRISIGAVPVRTLGLRDRFSADEYGNRYTYAVTEPHTTIAGFSGPAAENGGITILDGNDNIIINDASYNITSHGPDGKGAYRYESANFVSACNGLANDVENCDNDIIFRDTRFNRGAIVDNFFDDSARWKQSQLISTTAGGLNSNNLWQESAPHIYNTNAGNVGIGTLAPEHLLEVQATSGGLGRVSTMVLDSNNSGVGTGPALEFKNSSGGYLASIAATETTPSPATDGILTFFLSNDNAKTTPTTTSGNTSFFTINQAGQVGVNTTPLVGAGITVNGNFNAGVRINNTTNSGRAYVGTVSGTNGIVFDGTANPTSYGVFSATLSGTGQTAYQTTPITAGNTAFRVTMPLIIPPPTNITGYSADLKGANSTGISVETSGGSSTAAHLLNTNVNRGCDVGTSSHGLNCVGNVHVAGNITASGSIQAFVPSDMRLKQNITPLPKEKGIDAIRQLRPVQYGWKYEAQKPTEMGLIAQELEKVLPELVHETKTHSFREIKGPIKTVQYDKLILPMLKAIQQLADENDALKARIQALEKASE